jgi:stage III sporulation protein AF
MSTVMSLVRNVIAAVLVVTAAMQLLPKPEYEKYVRFFAGLIVLILVLKPVAEWRTNGAWSEEALLSKMEEVQESLSDSQANGWAKEFSILQAKQYITDLASAYGCSAHNIQIEADVSADDTTVVRCIAFSLQKDDGSVVTKEEVSQMQQAFVALYGIQENNVVIEADTGQ